MAMRRPRVKVAANLSIRRPAKPSASSGDAVVAVKAESVKSETPAAISLASEPEVIPPEAVVEEESPSEENDSGDVPTKAEALGSVRESKPAQDVQPSTFKFPKPVEEPPRITTPAPLPQTPLEVNTDEPHSPKKLDSKFAYINALNSPRKRIRTESMTSNKSYSDVSLKSRKTIKQEVSQKASDARRDLRKRLNNIQNIDKQSLTMFDMIYYNPVKNPMKSPALSKKGSMENIPHTVGRESRGVSKSRSPTPAPARPIPDPPKATIQMTPQLKLGPNGEMILDETSLVVENEREREMRDTLAKTEVIYMDEFSGNSGYYSRFKRTKDWAPEETIRFYRCLHTIGTDFSMMIQLFPNRSRRDLKLKFKKEERLNLMLVNKALLYPKEFNIEELKQQFEEEDEELERQREQERQKKLEAEEKLLQQKLAKKIQLNQNKSRNPKKKVSKSARVMLDGEQLVKSEPLMKEPKTRKKRRKKEPVSQAKVPQEQEQQQQQEQPVDNPPVVHEPVYEQKRVELVATQKQELYPQSFQQCAQQLDVPHAEESTLDIASMDISIVDDASRSVYEIKAEPNVHPVLPRYETIRAERYADIPNVVTIQNLDDQSQTTMIYQEPTVTTTSEPTGIDCGLDSIEAKYYGACDVVYFPMPADAPIAHPVKTEPSYLRRAPSPALQYDLLPASAPGSYRPSDTPVVEPIVYHAPDPEPIEQQPSPSPPPEVPSKVEHIEKQEHLAPQEDEDVAPEEEETPADVGGADAEGEPEEPRGLGPLEDIDINSLVLVESQDTQNPGRTIYEIYVADPDTGKLSEKPLDVPEDVIENIRSILEVGED